MSTIPYFALPFGGGNLKGSTASSHPRKRKRATPTSSEDDGNDPPDEGLDFSLQKEPLLSTQLADLEKAQFTVSKNYPHQGARPSLRTKPTRASPDASSQQEEGRWPKDNTFRDPRYSRKLRQQHLSVLTTILHRSMLENNYTRAGRAWGMLLRTEHNGRAFDVRANGRWGIGAEILLRRKYQNDELQSSPTEKDSEPASDSEEEARRNTAREPHQGWFSKEGFEKAKDYYERLILDHPHHRFFPHRISALDFYPAMFSLWIYAIQEGQPPQEQTPQNVMNQPSISGDRDPKKDTLARATELADRMDSLMISPPYSDNMTLLDLRHMVRQWIDDLTAEGSQGC
jgi:hypothetical protein